MADYCPCRVYVCVPFSNKLLQGHAVFPSLAESNSACDSWYCVLNAASPNVPAYVLE